MEEKVQQYIDNREKIKYPETKSENKDCNGNYKWVHGNCDGCAFKAEGDIEGGTCIQDILAPSLPSCSSYVRDLGVTIGGRYEMI